MFHFLIGPDRQRLTAHRGLVQALSPALAALMNNGQIKESLSGTTTIEDLEEQTFIASCEFGYRGQYRTLSRKDEQNGEASSAEGKDLLKKIRVY